MFHNGCRKGFCVLRLHIVILVMSLCCLVAPAMADDTLVFSGESPYTGIQIYDKDDGLRYMQFGIYEQTVMRVGVPEYIHYPYIRSLMAGFAFAEEPVNDLLMLGLGGGTVPQFIAKKFPEVSVEVMEIDPLVVEVAQKYFGFKPGKHGQVAIGDGRKLLRKNQKKYDLIILDAYKAGGIPFHLTTREFMQEVKKHLRPGGVVAIHLWAEYANKYLHAQVKTIADVFGRNYSFYDGAGSFMIFATEHAEWLPKEVVVARGDKIASERNFTFDLAELIREQYLPASRIPTSGLTGQILTDDFAPVNLLRHQADR